MKRSGSAVWKGSAKEGQGTISTPSKALSETRYSFTSRFEGDTVGTNPEELIAGAHAGCFNMALSFILGNAGFTPDSLDTTATVNIENINGGWEITTIHLELKGRVPGLDEAGFQNYATTAKENCPVSKVLNAKISMNATLEK